MTYIKRMEVHSFKSFANKSVIELSPGFSTFVGENGSGKSNVIDALCFVLGKISKKSMRADMLTDLIFNGGKEGRPAKQAEVGLIFDNSQKVFPYEGNEFKISRKVLDKGTSVYKINEKPVKRQEILNALAGTRVNPDGFNVILQGDIQKFVDLSSEERRKIIEEVSGISNYDDKKNKSLRELEHVDIKLREAKAMLAEKERYMKEIMNDKKQAEKYLKLQEELIDKKASIIFKKIQDSEEEVTTLDNQLLKNNEAIKQSEDKASELRKNIQELNEKLNLIRDELSLKGDREQQELNRKIEKAKNQKMEQDNTINNHTRELQRIKQRKESVNKELKDIEAELKKTKIEIKTLDSEIKTLQKEIQEKSKNSGINQEREAMKLKDELLTIESETSKLNNELILTTQSMQSLQELNKAQDRETIHKSNLERISKSLIDNETKKKELYDKKREVDDYLMHLKSQQIKLEAKKNSTMDYAGIGVKNLMKSGINGIHGTIASLAITDKQFNTALSVAAGNKINAIITSDDITAQKCIEYLRRNQSGIATLIPLNKAKPRTISDELQKIKKINGVIDFAINLVRFDHKYRNAFEQVLGDTLIVHDINTARQVGFDKTRIVTLEGDLIETSGLMTGGFRGKSNNSFMDGNMEDEITKNEEQTRKYERYMKEISEALSEIEEEVIKEREEKARINSVLDELREEIIKLKPKTQNAGSTEEIQKKIKELSKRKEEISNELSQAIDEKEIQNAKDEIKELETQLSKLIINKGTLESRNEKITLKEQERLNQILIETSKEEEKFKKELSETRNELEQINTQLKQLSEEEAKFYKELKDLYNARDEIIKKTENQNKIINNLESGNHSIKEKNNELSIKRASVLAKLDGLKVAFEEFKNWEPHQVRKEIQELQNEANKLEVMIRSFGPVNMKALETYKEVESAFEEVKGKTDALSNEKEEIIKVIDSIEEKKKKAFMESFNTIRSNFERIFAQLSPGGIAKLLLDNLEDPLLSGVNVIARPKGKKLLTLKSMSGGEKTITALTFIFAIQEYSPTPFYIMDEVDAALDGINTTKLAELVKNYSSKSQFIIISHNNELISAADYLYGVSMDKKGVSNIISLKLPE